jgi:hypothetical protein
MALYDRLELGEDPCFRLPVSAPQCRGLAAAEQARAFVVVKQT